MMHYLYISICIKYVLYLDWFREVIYKNCVNLEFELNKTGYKYFFDEDNFKWDVMLASFFY